EDVKRNFHVTVVQTCALPISLRHREFVLAAQSLGAADGHVMGAHLLPNIAAPIIVMATVLIPTFIIAEAGLSFLGLGVQPPVPKIGRAAGRGRVMNAVVDYTG